MLKYLERDIEYFFERNCYDDSIYLALAYINIIRKFNLKYNESNKIFKIISQEITELVNSNRNIYNVLTVNEYKNLLWYLENNEKEFNKKFIEKIKRWR